MTRFIFSVVVAAMLSGTAGESLAGIVVVHDNRYVMVPGEGAIRFDQVGYNLPIDSNTVSSDGSPQFGALIVSVGLPFEAIQGSLLADDAMSGGGNAFADEVASPANVHSVFDVTFQVTDPKWFVWTGSIFNNITSSPDPGSAVIRSLMSSTGSPVLVESTDLNGNFFDAGELLPGVDYRLVLSSSELPLSTNETTAWSFTFTLPEPALSLELAGLVGVGILLRRRAA
jgi:hypothetical protein